jgi:protein-L-isoaspartate(D-aspartate) O-methyltransferase
MNTTTSFSNRRLEKNSIGDVVFSPICGFLLLALAFAPAGLPAQETDESYAASRAAMVEKDLRGRGIRDPRVLEAMHTTPRHLFVPESYRREAYTDGPLSIGEGQTISQPYIVALMTELLALRGHEKVLEIGTGSGYQAAVLARLAKEVYTIEVVPALATRAAETLKRLGYTNVAVKSGDGFFGWPENAPFDAILITAAAEIIPDPLWMQLVEGGTLVMPLGEQKQTQKLIRVRKVNGKRQIQTITDVLFVPMTGRVRREDR